jgi:hypothetical protein
MDSSTLVLLAVVLAVYIGTIICMGKVYISRISLAGPRGTTLSNDSYMERHDIELGS